MLEKIMIKGLFGRFDYILRFKEDGVTIITGPNGYGKSTILKCIEAIREENVIFFARLDFIHIDFIFEDDSQSFFISKRDGELSYNGITIPSDVINENVSVVKGSRYIKKLDKDRWLDSRTGRVFTDPLEYSFANAILNSEVHNNNSILDIDHFVPKKLYEMIKSLKDLIGPIYYIKEQRLIMERKNGRSEQEVVNVIEELPNKFKNLIRDISNNYSAMSNKLDGSYPYRLFNTESGISEEEYKEKMEEMANKFEKLRKYDISDMQNSANVVFKEEHAKALKIYFDDFNEKYKVYEDFIRRLDLFTDVVNGRLSFKEIKISRESGIIVVDSEKPEKFLELNQLSSGEKQEIVLFYELIFETTNDVLLLIDEPEISLHIIWQKMFMDDMLKTVKYIGFKVIVATHSPQIINNHWDKQIDLGALYSEQLSQK
jgi:predicted ATP-binding protein involved in virulence